MSTNVSWFNFVNDDDKGSKSLSGTYIQIGRGPDNDVVLDNPSIANHAIVLECKDEGWHVIVIDGNSIEIDDREVFKGDTFPVQSEDQIRLFPYTISLRLEKSPQRRSMSRNRLDDQMSLFIRELHVNLIEHHEQLLKRIYDHLDSPDQQHHPEKWEAGLKEGILDLETDLDVLAERTGLFKNSQKTLLDHFVGHTVRSELLSIVMRQGVQPVADQQAKSSWNRMQTLHPGREQELDRLAQHVSSGLKLDDFADPADRIDAIEDNFWSGLEILAVKNSKRFLQVSFATIFETADQRHPVRIRALGGSATDPVDF